MDGASIARPSELRPQQHDGGRGGHSTLALSSRYRGDFSRAGRRSQSAPALATLARPLGRQSLRYAEDTDDYAEYQGGSAGEAFTLRSRDHERQVQQSNIDYIVLDVPKNAPTGLYALSHFEMRLGSGATRPFKVFSINDVYLPDIEVEEATEPEIPWPKVGRSA